MKPRPSKRLLLTLAACVVAGAVISVVVAAGCAIWVPVQLRFGAFRTTVPSLLNAIPWTMESPPPKIDWDPTISYPVGGDVDPDMEARFSRLKGLANERWMAGYLTPDDLFRREGTETKQGLGLFVDSLDMTLGMDKPETANVYVVCAGWPLACTSATYWEVVASSTSRPTPRWEIGIPAPAMLHPSTAYGMFVPRVIPLSPRWPGLLLDTAFYAAILWTAFVGRSALVRTLRRRAGRCAVCGYDLRGLQPGVKCPECGGDGGK